MERLERFCVVVLLLAAIVLLASGVVSSRLGIGLSDPPDSPPDSGRYNCGNMFLTHTCAGTDPRFERWKHSSNPSIQLDFDLLLSETLSDSGWEFTQGEINSLLECLYDTVNVLGTGDRDIAIVTDYFLADTSGYDPEDRTGHFELFEDCDTIAYAERNHIDIYVGHTSDANHGGYSSGFIHPREDSAYVSCDSLPSDLEMYRNSLLVLSKGDSQQLWKERIAAGVAHEYTHMLNFINRDVALQGRATDEILACGAAYLTAPKRLPPRFDTLYEISTFDYSPSLIGEYYRHWTAWAGYLLEQYKSSDLDDQPLHRWVRKKGDDGKIHASMCELARVLDDDLFSDLGGTGDNPGDYRLGRLHSDFAAALWVDDDGLGSKYSFGDSLSPANDLGFFRKVAPVGHCWEKVVSPEHIVGSEADSTWISIPGGEDCWDYNSRWSTEWCADPDSAWCDSLSVWTWGSTWTVFRTDTLYYDESKQRDLRVRVMWPELEEDDEQRLWLRVIEYPNERDSLYLYGGEATRLRTGHFTASSDSVEFWVDNFTDGETEAMVLIISAVDTAVVASATTGRCPNETSGRQPRHAYTYSYSMFPTPPGGCPFLSVWDGASFALDNNILAGAGGQGSESTDAYVVRERFIAVDGKYKLRITEDEEEDSWFDQVLLAAVDHDSSAGMAIHSSGSPVLYSDAEAPAVALARGGVNVVEALRHADGRTVEIGPDRSLEVRFPYTCARGDTRGGFGGLVLCGKPSQKIEQPLRRTVEPGVIDLGPLHSRANTASHVLDLPDSLLCVGDTLIIRVLSPFDYHLDYAAVATVSSDSLALTPCPLLTAHHSSLGEIHALLETDDGSYATLSHGERIDLDFRAPDLQTGSVRDLVLLANGYYQGRGGPRDGATVLPTHYALSPNYPNPFGATTNMRFDVPNPGGPVAVRIYNLRGQVVRVLVDEYRSPGSYSLEWDGTGQDGERVSSGVYFYSIEATGFRTQRKMLLLK